MEMHGRTLEIEALELESSLTVMAQHASKDTSLLASVIDRYREVHDLSWAQVGAQLSLSDVQLARLALCRIPRPSHFAEDLQRIARFVNVDEDVLRQFVQGSESKNSGLDLGKIGGLLREEVLRIMMRSRTWAVAFAAAILVIVGAVSFAQPKPAAATLVVSMGEALVTQSSNALFGPNQTELVLPAGELTAVSAGDQIVLGAGAMAQLRLIDGTTVDISEGTSLAVEQLVATDSSYIVELDMLSGRTLSRVKRLLGVDDAFRISTPSSTASVRGTVFVVEVLSAESTYVAVDEGVVVVSTEDAATNVTPGFEITTHVGEALKVQSQEDDSAAAPPAGGGDPPGPPDTVPGNPPQDTPGNPPAGGGDPPGPPEDVPGKPPRDVPAGPPEGRPVGKPETVPGRTPRQVSGNGSPPEGGGDPPGKTRAKGPFGAGGPPDGVPGKPPTGGGDPPGPPDCVPGIPPQDGSGNPPAGGCDPPGPPDSVPGNPPAGGGDPPGQSGDPPSQGGGNNNSPAGGKGSY